MSFSLSFPSVLILSQKMLKMLSSNCVLHLSECFLNSLPPIYIQIQFLLFHILLALVNPHLQLHESVSDPSSHSLRP